MKLMTASDRINIDVAEASEIARLVRQDDPDIVSTADLQALLGHSALVLDGQRRRPRYFDGRFLTGADLTRDQDYIRQRQADLARACGTGVVTGLQVRLGGTPGGETLVIEAGHGITPSGELVLVTSERAVPILDLAASRRLDATLGLRLAPRQPLGRRSGVFLLVLRPVEFSANPIAAYPTTLDGPRQVEDGDIIEATAIDLVAYPDTGGAATLDEARRTLARRLFLGEASGLPQNALPLAAVALDKGIVRWLDVELVRRETGADTPLQASLGARPRALAEAFVLQHRRHLADVLAERARTGLPAAFAASQYFAALPAAGQLPAAAILPDRLGFRQMWFPAGVDVDLSFVPEDEIATLVEQSLALPPLDLLAEDADLDAAGMVVLAPVSRTRLQRLEAALGSLQTSVRADPAQGIRRAPAQMLAQLVARRAVASPPVADREALARSEQVQQETRQWQAAWAEAVAALPADEAGVPLLWYARRRAVAQESRMVGLAVMTSGADRQLTLDLERRLTTLELLDELRAIAARATPFATARMYAFLGTPRIGGSTILTAAALRELGQATPQGGAAPEVRMRPSTREGARPATRDTARPTAAARARVLLAEGDILAIAGRYADPNLADGLDAIAAALPGEPLAQAELLWLGGTGEALDLDRAGRHLSGEALTRFAGSVAELARQGDDAAARRLAELIAEALAS